MESKKPSRKPKYSKFTQQELPACKPVLTPVRVVLVFVAIGIVFIPLGLLSLFASEHVVEVVRDYQLDCVPPSFRDNMVGFIQNATTNKTCTINMIVPHYMKHPIYVYYQLDNFYQNHRRYVRSKSDKQLRNKADQNSIKDCDDIDKTGKLIVPCGLIAWSLFNDTYQFSVDSKSLGVNKTGIAWESDRKQKFGSDVFPKNFQSGPFIGGAKLNSSIPLSEQEDLIVWMRTAAMSTFRKLYGKIEEDLDANTKILVAVQNNYNTYSFGGKKRLILSTTTWIGGKNRFIGVGYLIIGGLSMSLAFGFILLYVLKPRPIGDPSYLSWNRTPAGHMN